MVMLLPAIPLDGEKEATVGCANIENGNNNEKKKLAAS